MQNAIDRSEQTATNAIPPFKTSMCATSGISISPLFIVRDSATMKVLSRMKTYATIISVLRHLVGNIGFKRRFKLRAFHSPEFL